MTLQPQLILLYLRGNPWRSTVSRGSLLGKNITCYKQSTCAFSSSGKPTNEAIESQKETSKQAKAKLKTLLADIVSETTATKATKSAESSTETKDAPTSVMGTSKAQSPKLNKNKAGVKKGLVPSGEVKLGKHVLSAVKKAAAVFSEDAAIIEKELVKQLKTQATASEKARLSEILTGMTVESRSKDPATGLDIEPETSFSRRNKSLNEYRNARFERSRNRSGQQLRGAEVINHDALFRAQPLGIFGAVARDAVAAQIKKLKTWNELHRRALELAVSHPPANGFEEMIMWTKQGKLWKYPLDNEQGKDDEKSYSFEEHVFLEPLIDTWCPESGPIREFMQLVCTSLSKNPYLTVPEKKEYIEWYYDYFKQKQSILTDIGLGKIKQIGKHDNA